MASPSTMVEWPLRPLLQDESSWSVPIVTIILVLATNWAYDHCSGIKAIPTAGTTAPVDYSSTRRGSHRRRGAAGRSGSRSARRGTRGRHGILDPGARCVLTVLHHVLHHETTSSRNARRSAPSRGACSIRPSSQSFARHASSLVFKSSSLCSFRSLSAFFGGTFLFSTYRA